MELETMTVTLATGDDAVINVQDFDPALHTASTADAERVKPKPKPKTKS